MNYQSIRAINLGSWLNMEGYILGGRNIPESEFKDNFKEQLGDRELEEFESVFRSSFILRKDFSIIAGFGANAIRLPFHYKVLEEKPYKYSRQGLKLFKKVFQWAEQAGLKVILDLHSAAGAQNTDWHSDSTGKAGFWLSKTNQHRTISLWEFIAGEFKDEPALAGYDLINEPVPSQAGRTGRDLYLFYEKLIKRLRRVDKNSLIFIEGDMYGQQIDFLSGLVSETVWPSIHAYQPISFTFNFTPGLRFPGKIEGREWNKAHIRRYFAPYRRFAKANKTRIFVGEFGINWRGGYWGELEWLSDMLSVFNEYDFDYAYWTYKAVAQMCYPDGILQSAANSKFIKREGPVSGWERYSSYWPQEKEAFERFFKASFVPNRKITSILKRFFKDSR